MQMNSKAVVKMLLSQEAMTYKKIIGPMSEKTGKKYTEFSFAQRLARGSFKYDEMLALCEILGYEIQIKKL